MMSESFFSWKCMSVSIVFLLLAAAWPALAEAQTSETASFMTPNPDRSAEDVVAIQLQALKDNDKPSQNAGIEQVWIFAHPKNKTATGPLPRFTRMIKGPGYSVLVNHSRHEIAKVGETEKVAIFTVRVLSQDGDFYGFNWRLEKAELASGSAWMTTQVSPAQITGEQLSRQSNKEMPEHG